MLFNKLDTGRNDFFSCVYAEGVVILGLNVYVLNLASELDRACFQSDEQVATYHTVS